MDFTSFLSNAFERKARRSVGALWAFSRLLVSRRPSTRLLLGRCKGLELLPAETLPTVLGPAPNVPVRRQSLRKPDQDLPPSEPIPHWPKRPRNAAPRFDFNDGCWVMLPGCEQPLRVGLSDIDTRCHLRTSDISGESS